MKTLKANNLFDINTMVELLNKIGVKAELVNNELTFDADTLKTIKGYEMPHMIYANKNWLLG